MEAAKMVQSLMSFRTQVQKRPADDLFAVHRKLQEFVARERVKEAGAESFATHLLWAGTDLRTIQELLGHSDVVTTIPSPGSLLPLNNR